MTENEALNTLHILLAHEKAIDAGEIVSPNNLHSQEKEALQFILEEIQAYRAIGTVEELEVLNRIAEETAEYVKEDKKILETYQRIGTIEEFKALKKKHIGSDNMVISSSDLMKILNSDSEELKQYKEVGTVEEFKALKEKSEPKKTNKIERKRDEDGFIYQIGECPCCSKLVTDDRECCDCMQKLDWSE